MERRSFLAAVGALGVTGLPSWAAATPVQMVVMDPLAAELACPCVKGYAQRDYTQLAKFLEGQIGRPIQVTFAESLAVALEKKTNGQADIVIGKESVVRTEAKARKHAVTPVAALTGKDGLTTQTGLLVVLEKSAAKSVTDLAGYRILFGPAECDEKHAAAVDLLTEHKIAVPDKREIAAACTEGATKLLELGADAKAAAVISSYAKPLLEGCGTIKKGDLRVVGTTKPVAFVMAFVADALPEKDKATAALLALNDHPALLTAMESKQGFVKLPSSDAKKN
jgi:ABC-type phosphate/phosphonate transport system substrate-binding protein